MPVAAALPAVIGAGASIGGALLGSSAAGKAANVQAQAANHAADLQNQQYMQSRDDAAPWRAAGGQAIGQLSDMLQPGFDYTKSPGYDFRFNEGRRAVEGSAAAKGLLMSGGNFKDLTRYGQGFAANDFTDQFNRVASVAQGGQQVNSSLAQLGQQAASNSGNALMQGGQARASGYIGQANAISGGLGNLAYLAQIGAFGGNGGGTNFSPSSAIAQGNAALNQIPVMQPFSGNGY